MARRATPMDPLWFKDAIIYELHVKAFFDANNDGIGDFPGLISKLDYLRDLGVNAVWLLPFYPSPLRDDGYDVSDYRSINPSYGTMRDFRTFVREAHARDIRVITELVVNHTSDQHPWFQKARRAPRGSSARNFYIWSDDDRKWPETRIIFTDTESSNWSWDPVAQQFYWHRFFSHQPDLNFDNPRVIRAVIDTMRYWLNMGVDGLRLDAIPYLVERDGTNNENLPETHDVIRQLRAELNKTHPTAFFLAEANQWPEDAYRYFGEAGDECQMCFHFPLMPRMYMAVATEDRYPLTDIIRQTPEIPETCQWAIFLRNHDELTLEMVTDQERDYLWQFYAADKRARINLGIRRRLAPLMGNDQRKIKLLNSLLFSMPGTPILYYGDEIGMGDNIYLGDRDGVRTPMQWSPDRNGGFSRADPASLYLPVIQNPVYGFQGLNVEAQQNNGASLLNWMRHIIHVRKRHRAFGRGSFTLLYPGNRKILAYVRHYEDETILCVANLSRRAQAVELTLSQFKGRVPVELLDRCSFPPIGDLPYLLTLPGYTFYWFLLAEVAAMPSWHEALPEPMPDLATLVIRENWGNFLQSRAAGEFERAVLPVYLTKQRWFAGKDVELKATKVRDFVRLAPDGAGRHVLVVADVSFADGRDPHPYCLPMTVTWDESLAQPGSPSLPFVLCKVRRAAKVGVLEDAAHSATFPLAVIRACADRQTLIGPNGRFLFEPGSGLGSERLAVAGPVRPVEVEQSNTSFIIGHDMVLKVLRHLTPGINPEVEMGRHLTEVCGYTNIPPLLGAVRYVGDDGKEMALAVLLGYVPHQGDGWTVTTEFLQRELEELLFGVGDGTLTPTDRFEAFRPRAEVLGVRTAELHQALARETGDPAFDPEPMTDLDLETLRTGAKGWAQKALRVLRRNLDRLDEHTRTQAESLLIRGDECMALIAAAGRLAPGQIKTRMHGDFHLGQVLASRADFVLVDFEGEPARPAAERRLKGCPLRDVAGMLRSFDYAAWSAALELLTQPGGEQEATLLGHAFLWRDLASTAFLDSYRTQAAGCPSVPDDPAVQGSLLDLLVLEKALYEICYEAANRPHWLKIPVRGVLSLLDKRAGATTAA